MKGMKLTARSVLILVLGIGFSISAAAFFTANGNIAKEAVNMAGEVVKKATIPTSAIASTTASQNPQHDMNRLVGAIESLGGERPQR